MKKILILLMLLHGTTVKAYEYSSDDDHKNHSSEREEWTENDSCRHKPQHYYGQNDRQSSVQIYLTPNQNSYLQNGQYRHNSNSKQYREERYWRERREDLENQPERIYRENPSYRDENHW